MSYTRSGESGYYIYPTDETVEFVVSQSSVSNEEIDVFLYKIFSKRKSEFFKRIKNGKRIINKFKKELPSEYDLNKYREAYKFLGTPSDREILNRFIKARRDVTMMNIKSESRTINPNELPKSLRKYAHMIEDFEKSNEYEGDNDYWCYLADGYETEYGTGTIHDTLSMIRAELKDIERRSK